MIVDTSVWIDFFNNQPSLQAVRLKKAIEENESIVLPGIVLTEILLGFSSDKQAKKVSALLEAFDMPAELSVSDYQYAATIYRQCRKKGKTIRSTIDCLIAALCLRDDKPLLSKDRDFESIALCFPLKLIAV